MPVKMAGAAGSVRTPAPVLGQHTRGVLGELGYDPDRIAAMAQSGVI